MIKALIDKALDILLIIILSAMSVIVGANVFFRFVLNHSIFWGDELAQVLLVWITFVGAAVGIREQSHYVLNLVSSKLPPHVMKYYVLLRDSITLAAIIMLLIFSTEVALAIHSWVMPAMEISRSLVYGAGPIGCLFMLYYMVLRMIENIKNLR